MVVALAGPPQSGKTENQPAIEAAGWRFVNLNETGDALRCAGGPLRGAFEALAPGVPILSDSGKRRADYYMAVQRDPTLLERFTALELPYIRSAAQAAVREPGNSVLSWEQWELLVPDVVEMDHALFLTASPQTWGDRLRIRAQKRGYSGPPLSNEILFSLMAASGFNPETMLARLVDKIGEERITVVNTDEDWGIINITRELTRLAS